MPFIIPSYHISSRQNFKRGHVHSGLGHVQISLGHVHFNLDMSPMVSSESNRTGPALVQIPGALLFRFQTDQRSFDPVINHFFNLD